MRAWETYLDETRKQGVEDLCELLRIPSVSTEREHREDCQAAATWLLDRLESLGFDGELHRIGDGHPVLEAELVVDEDAPTATIYGHYDVQPPDPLDAWTTPPFEPTIDDGPDGRIVRARGATDDKGQLFANIRAVEAHVEADTLPVNVRFLIEGEEEVGGHSLPEHIEANRDALACDAVLVSDTHLWSKDRPAIVHGLRGIVTLQATVRAAERDLHSGQYGGLVMNPAEALARAVSSLKDDELHVTVPGFYDDVREITEEQRGLMDEVPFDADSFFEGTGVEGIAGEGGFSDLERLWARPTLEVNGLSGGYTGDGFKTIIPGEASVKLSSRIVADQDPDAIGPAILDALAGSLPDSVSFEGELLQAAPPWYVAPGDPVLQAAGESLSEAFGGETVFIRHGASIPVVPHLGTLAPVALMGYGMRDERLHAPDEFFRLENFHRGSVAMGTMLERLAEAA